ncbi:MAG: NAD(+) synthase, partial [Betaproteobacteria bacterium]|nr:NAD(+) synthase [Betaproteobacteria bacterium]
MSQETKSGKLHAGLFDIDYGTEADRIAAWMRHAVGRDLRRRGVIIAMSGGIDSSVCAALAVRAFGTEKVFGLMLPEQDSSSFSEDRATVLAKHLGINFTVENIAPTLAALGCYRWRDDAIRVLFPEYTSGWKSKIVVAGQKEGAFNYFKLVVQTPAGEIREVRLPPKEYMQIVAATNYKQRIRKTVEYFHADRLNYA